MYDDETTIYVGITIINHPLGNGIYQLSMVTWGMVYYCYTNISSQWYHDFWGSTPIMIGQDSSGVELMAFQHRHLHGDSEGVSVSSEGRVNQCKPYTFVF